MGGGPPGPSTPRRIRSIPGAQECLALSPAPKPALALRATQRQVLELRQLQALECLQLPAEGLEAWLREAAEANPALQVEERPAQAQEPSGLAGAPLGSLGRTRGAGSADHAAWLAQLPDERGSWLERGLTELDPLPEPLRSWARLLLESVDETGLLTQSDRELLDAGAARGLGDGTTVLGAALACVQALEPRGLGARSAEEALLLQLDPEEPDYQHLAALVEEHLQACAAGRRRSVAGALGISLEHLERLLLRLARLQPQPLAAAAPAAPALRPEVEVRLGSDGQPVVELVRGVLPEIHVDRDLESLARDRAADRATRSWLRPRVDEARRVLDAVRQRQETLLLVAAAAVRHQRGWLAGGEEGPRTLTMTALAEELGLATSTVSRAVAGKALDTPRGVLTLRSLFRGEGPAPGVDRTDARARVGALVAAEDPTAPLSDDAIAERLAGEGLRLARRTVAKYRRELGLGSSFERRDLAGASRAGRDRFLVATP